MMCRSLKHFSCAFALALLIPFQANALSLGELSNTFCSAVSGMAKIASPLFKTSNLWQGVFLGRSSKIAAAVTLGVGAAALLVFVYKRLSHKRTRPSRQTSAFKFDSIPFDAVDGSSDTVYAGAAQTEENRNNSPQLQDVAPILSQPAEEVQGSHDNNSQQPVVVANLQELLPRASVPLVPAVVQPVEQIPAALDVVRVDPYTNHPLFDYAGFSDQQLKQWRADENARKEAALNAPYCRFAYL